MKFIKDLLTEDDGTSWCFARVMSLCGFVTFFTISIMSAHTISITDYANGFATLLAGAGAIIAAKQATTAKK